MLFSYFHHQFFTLALTAIVVMTGQHCSSTFAEEDSFAIILVSAKTVKVEPHAKPNRDKSTHIIDKVFVGDDKLVGKEFIAFSSISGEDSMGASLYPTPKLNELGIWALRSYKDKEDKNKGELFPFRGEAYGIRWPIRDGVGANDEEFNYKNARLLAEAVESVYRSPLKDRIALLKKLTDRKIAMISGWAIEYLKKIQESENENPK